MPIVDYTTPGTYTWTVPNWVNQVTVTCIGGGGNGEYDTAGSFKGSGGSGGGFAKSLVSVTPGQTYTIVVGSSAQATTFATSGSSVFLCRGANGLTNSPTAGSSGSIGNIVTVEGGRGNDGSDNPGRGGRAGNLTTMTPLFRSNTGIEDNGGFGVNLDGTQNTSLAPGVSYNRTILTGPGSTIAGTPFVTTDEFNWPGIGYDNRGYLLSTSPNRISGTYISAELGGGVGDGQDTAYYFIVSNNATSSGNVTWTIYTGGIHYNNGTAYGGGGAGNSEFNSNNGLGAPGAARLEFDYVQPTITSFIATPSLQDSGTDGIPNYNSNLSWTIDVEGLTGTLSYTINSISGFTGLSGGITVNDLSQSIAGSNSPSTTSYTLTVSNGFYSDSEVVTVSAYNDNTPNNYTVPNQTNLEPNTPTTIQVGPITGIDMVTSVTGGSGVSVSNNNVTYSSSTTIQNNQVFYVRAFSPPFNTDPNGLTNSTTYSVTVGTVQRFFTLTTRAPDVEETFNFADKEDYVPSPDIDTIPDPDAAINNQSNQYIVSDTLLIDDIELGSPNGVEIKVDKPDVQVRIKRSGQSTFGSWQNARQI